MANIGIDIDGTIDAFPNLFQHLIAGWKANADHVYVITGITADVATDDDHANKVGYLTALGIPPEMYYQLVVIPHSQGYVADAKAQYIQDNHIDLLIDNNVENCKAAKKYCAVFCLWNVKEKDGEGTTTAARAAKTCQSCGTVVSKEVETCPQCGADLSFDTNEGLANPGNDRLPLV